MITRNDGHGREKLARNIRRQFGNEATTRFLSQLPAFRIESDIPDYFRELLDRLDGMKSSMIDNEQPRRKEIRRN